jgi:hypothetical protein
MGVFDDSKELVKHAEAELPKIRAAYEASLNEKAISPALLIEIKNFCENLRSALDFSAAGLFERYGTAPKGKKPKTYFPYALATQGRSDFERSGRIEMCIPGITASRPDVVAALVDMQHFGAPGREWLPKFMELNNENKHQRLAPQTRKEVKELRVSGGGASMSLGQGASITVGRGASISIGGAVIHGGQSFDVNRPPSVQGGKVEVITWVSFHFAANDEPVMSLLESALAGTRTIVAKLASM